MRQIHRSLISALLAVGVGAGLVALAYWSKQRGERNEEAAAAERRPFSLDRGALQRVTVAHGGDAVVLEQRADRWHVTSPIVDLADSGAMSGLLNAAQDLELAARFESTDDLPDLGALMLDPPRVEIRLESAASAVTIHLGRKNPFDGRVYVRAGTQPQVGPVGMVEGPTATALDKDLWALREKRLCPLDTSAITALQVQVHRTGDEAVSFTARRGDGQEPPGMKWDDPWRLEAPVAQAADRDTIDDVLRQLTTARFSEVIAEDPGAGLGGYGLDAPWATVRVETEAEARELSLGRVQADAGERLFARRGGVAAITDAPPGLLAALRQDLFSLEEKRVLVFDPDQVRKIKLIFTGSRLAMLEREVEDGGADAWTILSPRPGPAMGWRVSSLLYALGNMKATRYAATALAPKPEPADLASYGLDAPERSITLYDGQEQELGALLIGRAEGEVVYAMRRGGDKVAAVERGRIDELPSDLADLAEAPVDEDAGE